MNPTPRSVLLLALAAAWPNLGLKAGQTLPNGIQLPDGWPPNASSLPDPTPPPYYLKNPPAVIPIDVGRQLFVDDFLIASTTLKRKWHEATYCRSNPIIPIDRPWEMEPTTDISAGAVNEIVPAAMTFAGGVWYDPQEGILKMFYDVLGRYLCLATSTDGIAWTKPKLDVRPGTNIVLIYERNHDGRLEDTDAGDVWMDANERDPAKRFKALCLLASDLNERPDRRGRPAHAAVGFGLSLRYSKDGRRWSKPVVIQPGYGDGGNLFYDPFRKVWGLGIRDSSLYFKYDSSRRREIKEQRIRRYHEGSDVVGAFDWGTTPVAFTQMDGAPPGVDHTVLWQRADSRDEHFAGPWDKQTALPGLYDTQVNAYESILLATYSILPGWWPDGKTKRNYGSIGFSRDGFTFERPNRREFLPRGKYGEWNTGYVHPAGGVCLVVGDKLYFYVGARQAVLNNPKFNRQYNTGLAVLRRDGFASMDAGVDGGVLTTRAVRFEGKYLFANFDAPAGELKVEVLDQQDRVIAPFTLADCLPSRGDRTCGRLSWKGEPDLSALAGKAVRFRFHLANGKLYSFWVSSSTNGASHGYVAAGGPGFTGPTDTVGTDLRPDSALSE